MPTTISPDQIEAYLLKKVVEKYKMLQVKLPEYLKEFIYSEYYDKYDPVMYERQYRIIDAIMISNIKISGTMVFMEIYLDPDRAKYDPAVWESYGRTYYIQGDSSETVFDNIRKGIHGSEDFAVTDGDFWQSFIDSVNHGGIYDLFADFKKYLGNSVGLTVK